MLSKNQLKKKIKKRGNTYYLQIQEKNRRLRESLNTSNPHHAIEKAYNIYCDWCSVSRLPKSNLRFSQIAKVYIDSKINLRPSSIKSYKKLEKIVLDNFGDFPINKLEKSYTHIFNKKIKELLKKYSKKTINLTINHLKSVFKYGVKVDLIQYNFFDLIEPPNLDKNPIEILDEKEIEAGINYFKNDSLLIFKFAISTGLRVNDIRLSEKKFLKKYYYSLPNSTKDKTPVDIPITSDLYEELKKRCEENEKYIFENIKTKKPYAHIDRAIKKWFIEIGRGDHLSFHNLRKTFATHFLANGGDIPTLMAICGWNQYSTAEKYINKAKLLKQKSTAIKIY